MSVNLTIPSVGESISEGTIARWLKKDGERVEQGEPLFELETDKATTEIPAPSAGTLRIRVAEGKTVAVGAMIGTLEEGADGRQPAREKPEASPRAPRDTEERKKEKPTAKPKEQEPKAKEKEEPAQKKPKEEPEPEPKANRDGKPAGEKPEVREPPPSGRKLEDESAMVAEPAEPLEKGADKGETRRPMSAIRQRIAQHLLASQQNTATLTTFNEADLSVLQDLRARYQARFRDQHGVKLGLVSFFVKACAHALQAYPVMNAFIDQNDIVYHHYCNMGVAVSTEKGLMVPVLHHAERMSFAQIEKSIAELAEKARAGKMTVQDLQDGTFTISNGGVFGSLFSTPILNPPQSAILGLHAIQKRPVAVDDQVVIRPMMYLALSYDHRLIDGRDAVQFLACVKEYVETPERMLLEI